MNILVVAESLRINETSSGIVSSTFLAALAADSEIKVTCIFDKNFDYNITWLKNIDFIELKKRPYKPDGFIDKIPKFRGLSTHLTGIHPKDKQRILEWKNVIDSTIAKNEFNLIITLGSGSEFLPYYAMLDVKTNIPWLANFHDPYPMSVYPEPYKEKRNPIYKKQERITKRIIDKANYISFPSVFLKDLMQEFYNFNIQKSIILPHIGLELKNLPIGNNDDSIDLKKGKLNLLHAGTLLGPRKVDALLKAFSLFINSDEEKKQKTVLTILGKVAKENFSSLEVNIPKENLCIIRERVSYKKSIELNNKANVAIVVEANTNYSPFMPGKLADLLFLEKPILALTPLKSETLRILGKDYKYHSKSDDVEQILKCLNDLWDSWMKNELVLSNRKELKEYISGKNFISKIKRIM